jgi:hypothetical protein
MGAFMTDFLGVELKNRIHKKKPPGVRRFRRFSCVGGAYASISLPPVALEKLK